LMDKLSIQLENRRRVRSMTHVNQQSEQDAGGDQSEE